MDSFEGLCKNHELNHLSSVIILFVLAYVCVEVAVITIISVFVFLYCAEF